VLPLWRVRGASSATGELRIVAGIVHHEDLWQLCGTIEIMKEIIGRSLGL
jgi:hypothetical protein